MNLSEVCTGSVVTAPGDMPVANAAALMRTHRLFDGRTVTVRPVRRDDTERLREFVHALSADSRYMRFMKWIGEPTEKLMHFLTDIDYDRHMAFVCTVVSDQREQVVGEARYVINADGRSCDFGIVIADAWHKSGIAGLLMAALIEAARERGLAAIEGFVLHTNTKMIKFTRALGFTIEAVADEPTIVRVVKNL